MNECRCPNCGQKSKFTADTVRSMLISREGSKENWGLFFTCPECRLDTKLTILQRFIFWLTR